MNAIIVSVGDELARGATVDTNSAWMAQRLTEMGIDVLRHVTVADDAAPIVSELRRACAEAETVIISGGLGPTEDDRTRAALAELTEQPLEFDETSWRQIEGFFHRLGRSATDSNRLQAFFPRGTRPLENVTGTAPGIEVHHQRARIFALPGVPREMRAMFDVHVAPYLRIAAGARTMVSHTLHCLGLGEARIGELIAPLMAAGRNPSVGTRADEGVISIRIVALAESTDAARALALADAGEVRRLLGPVVFGEGEQTLSSVVGDLLRRKGMTVATAESCTGGWLGKQITEVPGSSDYYVGGAVTYTDRLKLELLGVPPSLINEHGAVSAPVAEAMAAGARQRLGSNLALAVTGIAGPGGATATKPVGLVYIALACAEGVRSAECRFPAEAGRETVRDRSVKSALDLLRRHLLGIGCRGRRERTW